MSPVVDDCRLAFNAAVGYDTLPVGRRSGMLAVDVTGPSQEQWDAGQRWARCNVTRVQGSTSANGGSRMLPLPAELANAADAYVNQVCCVIEDTGNEHSLCDSEAFDVDGAWLNILFDVPFSDLGAYPGTRAKAARRITSACADYVKNPADLTSRNYGYVISLPGTPDSDLEGLSGKALWETPGMVVSCAIPTWAYVNAPVTMS